MAFVYGMYTYTCIISAVLACLLIGCGGTESSWLRPHIRDTAAVAEAYGSLVFAGDTNEENAALQQWHRQQYLKQNAAEAEWQYLSITASGSLKTLAFMQLLKQPGADVYSLVIQSLQDSGSFFQQPSGSGCVAEHMLPGVYIVREYLLLDTLQPPAPAKPLLYLSDVQKTQILQLYYKRLAQLRLQEQRS